MTETLPTSRRSPLGRFAPLLAAGLFLLAAAAAVPSAQEPGEDSEKLEAFRQAHDQWVETRRIISSTRADWVEAEAYLADRIEMLENDIERVKARTAEIRGEIGESDDQVGELTRKRDGLKDGTAALAGIVGDLESRVKGLIDRMPDPLKTRLQPLTQGIPNDPAASETGLPRRFQNLIGILDGINKFHREISTSTERRMVGDGTEKEVTVMYLGVSLAVYATADGRFGGVGAPGPDGWNWVATDGDGEAIADAIAIYNNELPAAYVPVPATIQ
jgi:hypothetical protein